MNGDSTPFERAYDLSMVDAPSSGLVDVTLSPSGPGPVHTFLVRPADGLAWTGSVTADRRAGRGVDGIYGTPDRDQACLVVGGAAFLIDVLDPSASRPVCQDGSLRDVVELRADGLLLLATGWTITAIGERAVRWTTRRLAVESLRLDEVVDHRLHGVADPEDEAHAFTVDLRTGAVEGVLA